MDRTKHAVPCKYDDNKTSHLHLTVNAKWAPHPDLPPEYLWRLLRFLSLMQLVSCFTSTSVCTHVFEREAKRWFSHSQIWIVICVFNLLRGFQVVFFFLRIRTQSLQLDTRLNYELLGCVKVTIIHERVCWEITWCYTENLKHGDFHKTENPPKKPLFKVF